MRKALHATCLGIGMAIMPAGCDAPPPVAPVDMAPAPAPMPAEQEALPDPVAATVERLQAIAATGSYRDLARLADQTPDFRSNAGGMSHRDYWYLKLRTGDWPMAQVDRLLKLPHAVVAHDARRIFVWPRFATLSGEMITPVDARAINDLLGEGAAAALAAGGAWPGYVLGIAEDGTWLYFISGAG